LIEVDVPVIEGAAISVAVIVSVAAVFSVAEKVPVPFLSVELGGSIALLSELVK
jgi:hypothetical protein